MHKSNLILHCGSESVDRERLANVVTPPSTETYVPIPHLEFLQQVESNLGGKDLRIVNEAHALSHGGDRYFGLLQIDNSPVEVERKTWFGDTGEQIVFEKKADYGYIVGLRNAHDHSYTASLGVGSQVFVCDNLSFSAEIRVSRKHTRFISRDLPALTAKAIGLLAQSWTSQDERFDAYKQRELTGDEAVDLVISALDVKAITGNNVLPVLREWRAPRHPEFVECGPTVWRLFNAITEVSKEVSLFALPRRTTALHGLFDQCCGLMTAKEKAAAIVAGAGQDAEIIVNN